MRLLPFVLLWSCAPIGPVYAHHEAALIVAGLPLAAMAAHACMTLAAHAWRRWRRR